ncbi:MAG: SulP family inorganic anion transporter [Aureispira sp.]|nr:SulP family inorganic anion transporter [Aureispira sp.]
MNTEKKTNFFSNLKHDLPASIVVFLVAIPLCLGIALASNAPLFSGIIAGVVGGLIVTLFSDSPLGVSGPAAGLVAIVVAGLHSLGSFEVFLLAVVLAGVFQIIFGFIKAGSIGYYFPSSVITGMLAGIGLIIFLKQIPHAMGYDDDYEGDLAFFQNDGENTFSELFHALNFISPSAITISLISIIVLIVWQQPFIKDKKWSTLIQGPLVVVVLGVVLNLVFSNIDSWALSSDHLVALPVFSSFNDFLAVFTFPDFSQISNPEVITVAITIAVVASIESLLCAEATDKLDPEKRTTNLNKELKAQGIGNVVSGLIGGLPITQVIIRSSTSIQSGGKTRATSFFHGLLLLLCVVTIPFFLNLIPLASLAAILIMVGYKLAKPAIFIAVYKKGWYQFLPFVVTVTAILLTDLLIGIGIGMIVSIGFILLNNYKVSYLLHKEETAEGKEQLRIILSEDVSFLNKGAIKNMLKDIPDNSAVLIDATDTLHIDQDVLEIFEDFKIHAVTANIDLIIKGIGESIEQTRPEKFHLLQKNKKAVTTN